MSGVILDGSPRHLEKRIVELEDQVKEHQKVIQMLCELLVVAPEKIRAAQDVVLAAIEPAN